MTSHRRRNDRGAAKFKGLRRAPDTSGTEWIWGRHAVFAALANPRREGFKRVVATEAKAGELPKRDGAPPVERLDSAEIARLLPSGAVHQGFALLAEPLESADLDDFAAEPGAILLVLDQVTDPQNVGNILRSAAAFGTVGVVMQDRHAPPLTGAVAKAAVGALDQVPVARVVNLSRALETLTEAGWRTVGLAGEAAEPLHAVLDGRPTALVLGSEADGMRRLVAEHCDITAKILMRGGFESLNVGTAAAIALYEAAKLAR